MMTYFYVVLQVPWRIQVQVSRKHVGVHLSRQERCLGEGSDSGVSPVVVVAGAVGRDEVTLGENQRRGAEHLMKRLGRLSPQAR